MMNMLARSIPEELVLRFAAESSDLEFAIAEALENHSQRIYPQLREFLDSVGDAGEAAQLLGEGIAKKRLDVLLQHNKTSLPYSHPDLSGVEVDEHLLVGLNDFNTNRGALERGNTVFQVLPSLPASNSMYWAMQMLLQLSEQCDVRIRLDPFMLKERTRYQIPLYKMWVYGVSLDWKDIGSLREERHGRWMPDLGTPRDVSFTDFVWSPRADGVHFKCEELPNAERVAIRGSRYFHSIYDPQSQVFVHADGALRLFNSEQLRERSLSHVRTAGKAGQRVKIFQADGQIPRETWCDLAIWFFVWNLDVKTYFQNG